MKGEKDSPDSSGDDMVSINGFKTFDQIGDTLSGEIVGSSWLEMEDGRRMRQHVLLTDDGLFTINETAQLRVLGGIDPGTRVDIVYQGEINVNGGRRVRKFDIKIPRRALGGLAVRMSEICSAPTLNDQMALPANADVIDPFEDPHRTPAS